MSGRANLALALGAIGALMLSALACIALVVSLLWQSSAHTLGRASELRRDHPQLFSLAGHEFYLAWNDSIPLALSTTDPHSYIRMCANPIRFQQQQRVFVDPCGGSVYEPDGSYIRGPSPRSMDQFAVWIEAGWVKVDFSRTISGQRHP